MSDLGTFDVGGCHPLLQPVTEHQRGIRTPEGSPFSAGRRVYERGWKQAELSWGSVDLGVIYSLQDWWARSLGGVLTMDYRPDNQEAQYEIRFDGPIEFTQVSGHLYTVTAGFWQHIAA